jgi:hypothetical protein
VSELVADGLELRAPDSGYFFEIKAGGPDAHPSVRGEDVVIPGKDGRIPMNRVLDVRLVTLYGIVMGDGTGDSARTSFRSRMDALKAVFDPVEPPFPLTIHSPLHGVSGTATLNVRFLRFVESAHSEVYRIMDIECECVDDPPEWVIGS